MQSETDKKNLSKMVTENVCLLKGVNIFSRARYGQPDRAGLDLPSRARLGALDWVMYSQPSPVSVPGASQFSIICSSDFPEIFSPHVFLINVFPLIGFSFPFLQFCHFFFPTK